MRAQRMYPKCGNPSIEKKKNNDSERLPIAHVQLSGAIYTMKTPILSDVAPNRMLRSAARTHIRQRRRAADSGHIHTADVAQLIVASPNGMDVAPKADRRLA